MKTQKTLALSLAIGASLSLGALSASAQIVLNGDFSANGSSFTAHNGDFGADGNPTTATDWNAGQSGIQGPGTGVGTFLGPTDTGTNYFVYMFGPGSISQTITLAPSTEYTIDFSVGGRPGDSPLTNEVTVSTTQGGGSTFFDQTVTPSTAVFTPLSNTFTTPSILSGSGDATITLLNDSPGGKTVDFTDVSITAVPEPSTYALFGLGVLAVVIACRSKSRRTA
jgi:hypothetical protein